MFDRQSVARNRLFVVFAVLVALFIAGRIAGPARAADGSKGKLTVLDAKVPADQGDWYFKVELEPILFQIVSVQNKYKVLRVNIVNRSKKPLQLSLPDDRIQIQFGAPNALKTIDASLDMSHTDPGWWNGLNAALQKALAYPDQAAIRANEEENVFVFVPTSELPSFPESLRFMIKSYSKAPIIIGQRRLATSKS